MSTSLLIGMESCAAGFFNGCQALKMYAMSSELLSDKIIMSAGCII